MNQVGDIVYQCILLLMLATVISEHFGQLFMVLFTGYQSLLQWVVVWVGSGYTCTHYPLLETRSEAPLVRSSLTCGAATSGRSEHKAPLSLTIVGHGYPNNVARESPLDIELEVVCSQVERSGSGQCPGRWARTTRMEKIIQRSAVPSTV